MKEVELVRLNLLLGKELGKIHDVIHSCRWIGKTENRQEIYIKRGESDVMKSTKAKNGAVSKN